MKKVLFTVTILILLFFSVSPAFAYGKLSAAGDNHPAAKNTPGANGNQGNQGHGHSTPEPQKTKSDQSQPGNGQKHGSESDQSGDEDEAGQSQDENGPQHGHQNNPKKASVTPEVSPTPKHLQQPHGQRDNFLLFGTVTAFDGQQLTVQVSSGNALAQAQIGQVLTIQISDSTAVRLLGEIRHRELAGQLGDMAVGDTVRIHGWWIPDSPATDVTPTPDSTATDLPSTPDATTTVTPEPTPDASASATPEPTSNTVEGAWLARQITIISLETTASTPTPTPTDTVQ